MGRETCRWVLDRLPLLAGGELLGLERRRIERHVLDCTACRDRLAALRATLVTLHTAGQLDPIAPDAPSLWPALARQIQESRRGPAPRRVRIRLHAWTRLSLAATVLTVAGGLGVWALSQNYHVSVHVQVTPRPQAPVPRSHEPRFANGFDRPTPIRRSSQRRILDEAPSVEASEDHREPESSSETLAGIPDSSYEPRPSAEPTH